MAPTSRPAQATDSTRSKVMSFRLISAQCTIVLVILQTLSLQHVDSGPVVFNMDYSQGPVPLARNIRHLPCITRKTGQEGLCMFAIDCLKANGTHLGTCIDRFYFGSCCQIPDKTVIPQIITNHIDDNSIDGASFVHPQIEDIVKKPEPISRKTTTERPETTTQLPLETKSDEMTTIDNKISNDEATAAVEATTKAVDKSKVTEVPIKLSTFQSVSGVSSTATEKIETETTSTTTSTSTTETTPSNTLRPKPTKKPVRPSSFTRPTYKPYNITRPQYTQSTYKPKPTKPVLSTTRKPPYRLPPKRPSTKKPLPLPPRLNITTLPQSTSSKPLFTRPQSVITYINITQISTTKEPKPSSTTSSTTTTTPSTTTTEEVVTEKVTTEKVEITEVPETTLTTEALTERVTEPPTTEAMETVQTESVTIEEVTEKGTVRPVTEADMPIEVTSTDYPPFMTWSSNVDSVTKAPETVAEPTTSTSTTESSSTTTASTSTTTSSTTTEETWSPITPPEGWILLSTIAPKPESTITTSTTTEVPTTEREIQTTETVETSNTPELTSIETTQETTQSTTTTSSTTQVTTSTTVSTITSTSEPTTQAINVTETTPVKVTETLQEFTVNVTLSPTVPTTTASSDLTFTLLSTSTNETKANGTEVTSSTEAGTSAAVETSTNSTTSPETTTEAIVMTDYKSVCGRRLWQAPTGRIVGGAKSGFGMWPWQISLRQFRTSTYLHKCGAALLNENWAITAAHCVEHVPPSELLVRLGEHDLANEDEPYGFAERRVQIVASHPHFDPATFEYDLALLRFYEPVTFQPNILPVCVPDDDDDYVGKTAFVTGWGRLYDEGPLPSVLQEVKVPVINNSACEAMYQAAGYNEHIPNIFICAGRSKGGTDSCEGDSGGPMVLPRSRDGRFVLGGVISWGIGCAEPNQPGVYTRISEFRDWINQILQF